MKLQNTSQEVSKVSLVVRGRSVNPYSDSLTLFLKTLLRLTLTLTHAITSTKCLPTQ